MTASGLTWFVMTTENTATVTTETMKGSGALATTIHTERSRMNTIIQSRLPGDHYPGSEATESFASGHVSTTHLINRAPSVCLGEVRSLMAFRISAGSEVRVCLRQLRLPGVLRH
jgi:hypothetical protein